MATIPGDGRLSRVTVHDFQAEQSHLARNHFRVITVKLPIRP
jgi:hypothetical protein